MPQPLLHQYVASGDIGGVETALRQGADVDLRDPATDRTPLMLAVSSPAAPLEMVQLLLRHGADPNAIASDPEYQSSLETSRRLIAQCENTDVPAPVTGLPDSAELLKTLRKEMERREKEGPQTYTVLGLALAAGNLPKVKALLDAGADVAYTRSGGYDALIDVMHGRGIVNDPHLADLVRLLIARGARLDTVTGYAESALSVSSHVGRFDVVRILLDAGADPAPLRWTPLMRAIAIGSIGEVKAELSTGSHLAARDRWSRTPLLLAIQTGDVARAELVLVAGADLSETDRWQGGALVYAIKSRSDEMLQWVLRSGADVNQSDDFGQTPLITAAENGDTQSVAILLAAGADIQRKTQAEDSAIKVAANLQIVDLLVAAGADLNEISDEMRAAMTHLPGDGVITASRPEYQDAKYPRFGLANPEKMNLPFWQAMVRSNATAYAARSQFEDTGGDRRPVWSFHRFGKSITRLPDGRIIEVAGEHEDSYDPDFCIYNDVFVHHGDGTFDIYGYPKELFPPTDFHSATHIGGYIYIIGSLGYMNERTVGHTPVYRLGLNTYAIEPFATSGTNPGWISRHRAFAVGESHVRITGGQIYTEDDLTPNTTEYILDLRTGTWSVNPPRA